MISFFKSLGSFIKDMIQKTDKLFLILCVATSIFGVVMVQSASLYKEGDSTRDTVVMLLALVAGIVVAMVLSYIDYEFLLKMAPLIAVGGIGLMLLLIPFGVAPINRPDSVSWFSLGPLNFQPSELLKIGFILTFAAHLNYASKDNISSLKNVVLLGIHALVPTMLVRVIAGDDGSALVFLLICLTMMFVAGVHWGYFATGAAGAAIALPLVWTLGEPLGILQEYQKARFLAIFYPEKYALDEAYQQLQGLRAMGSGGVFGKGLFKGDFTQTGAVPESQNDMILSVVGEELGYFGILVAFILLMLIIWRIVAIGRRSSDNAGNLICWGVAAMIGWQAFINIGMAVGLLPVIGITLPFFSGGGSSTLTLYVGLGIVLGVARSNRRQQTFDKNVLGRSALYRTNLSKS